MDLQHLPPVVEPERLEVGACEATFRLLFREADGHGGAEHRQALVEAHHLLLVQPQQGAVQQALRVPDPAFQHQVGGERPQQVAEGGLRQQIRPSKTGRQAGEQMLEQTSRSVTPSRGGLLERAPFALQRHVHRLRVPLPQPQAPGTAPFPRPSAAMLRRMRHNRSGRGSTTP